MRSKVMIMPAGHEYDEMYLVVNGVSQGLISKGASSAESLGCHYRPGHGHEDEIIVQGFSYGASNPVHKGSGRAIGNGHSDAFGITKMVDKSSPLLHNAMNGEALSSVELKCYRTAYYGQPEHYYTVYLKHARVVVVDTYMGLESNEMMENVYFSYHQISLIHERCGTISKSRWLHSTSLQAQRFQGCQDSNDFNGYNALRVKIEHNRIFWKENPHYNMERLSQFWMVVALPFGGVILTKTSYGAYMWAYRNSLALESWVIRADGYWGGSAPSVNIGSLIMGVERTYDEFIK